MAAFYLAPWAWMGAFAVVLTAAVVQFGGLPSYADPDPKGIEGTDLAYDALFPLFFSAVLSPLVVGGETLWRIRRKAGLRAGARVRGGRDHIRRN